MSRVLVVPRQLKSGSQRFHQILNEAGFAVEYFPSDLDPMETQSMIETLKQGDFDAVLAGSEPYTDSVLEVAPVLRVIARVGVGYDAVDLEAASHRKIAVTIAPGTNEEAVAEHTIAMLLCIGRNLVVRDRDVRNAQWKRVPVLAPVRSCSLGIVGLGRIGREVAIRARWQFHPTGRTDGPGRRGRQDHRERSALEPIGGGLQDQPMPAPGKSGSWRGFADAGGQLPEAIARPDLQAGCGAR